MRQEEQAARAQDRTRPSNDMPVAQPKNTTRFDSWIHRPVGLLGTAVLVVLICLAPLWLFGDALRYYRLHSDDFPYLAGSRTFQRTLANLFTPHNTHIVPAWRLLTWVLVACAGRLAGLQVVLARASYLALVLAMLLTGRLVASETGRIPLALGAMVLVGTTSLVRAAATWYSAGQTLWAGIGVLAMLLFLQGWRRNGGTWRLVLASLSAWAAGSFWTIGHVAGPVGFVYLWTDGPSRSRRAAWVPLGATLLAASLALGLGARKIDATVSFHGRTTREALSLPRGVTHTLQAIPEDLVLGNLGLWPKTSVEQGDVLTAVLAIAWLWSCRRFGRPSPLECAGLALFTISYFVEWSFRGYLPFSSLRGVVPWYDTIPHLGFVLFAAGCWARVKAQPNTEPDSRLRVASILGIVAFQVGLILVHQPRVDALLIEGVPGLTEAEKQLYLTPSLQRLRAIYLADEMAQQQRRHLARFDRAEAIAWRLGITREGVHRAFGRLPAPELPLVYDGIDLLDLPPTAALTDPVWIRQALGASFTLEPEPKAPLREDLVEPRRG
jgi:hypothetical protein